MIVRPATPADADAIARVHVQAWDESYRGLVPEAAFEDHGLDTRLAQWRRIIINPDVVTRVIEHEGAICGFGSGGKARPPLSTACEIYSFYLLGAVKRRGFGRALFARMTDDLAARGFNSLGLWVLIVNAPARRFYEAMGGRLGGTHTDQRGENAFEDVSYLWDDIQRLR